jgi:hypothetical protein
MPLEVSPPRTSRFGSPLVLSRVHWVRPELVTEVKFFTREAKMWHEVEPGCSGSVFGERCLVKR